MLKTANCSRLFYVFKILPPILTGGLLKVPKSEKNLLPAQMLRIMKLTSFLLLVSCLHLSARTSSQTITLTGRDMALRKVFDVVEKQTGYVVFSNRELLKVTKPVSVSVQRMPLQQFLKEVLQGQPVSYRIENNVIILSKKPAVSVSPSYSILDTVPKNVLMTGVVTDENDKPIPRVSMALKGTSRGWTTNLDGSFTLVGPQGGVLTFSSVGFQPKEIVIKAGTQKIQLTAQINKLDDVVITGIFSRRAESFTGAAQTYTKEELLKTGTVNVIQSLKNIDPAFNLRENLEIGSNPNALPSIVLRGQSGFPDLKGEYQADPNQPLFILDGFEVPLTRVIDLDMNRVATITLLKDAAAKAIYGSKAANGVVVIETQRPKAGKMQVTYTGVLNVSAPDLTSYNLTNAAEKLDVERSAGLYQAPAGNSGMPNADQQYFYDEQYNHILEEIQRGVNTDWISKPVRTGLGQKHTLYVEGGSDAFRYALDFSYNTLKGVMKGSERNTTAGAITFSYRYKNLLLRNILDVSYNKGVNSPYGEFSEYARMNPYFRATDEYGRVTKIAGENLIIGAPVGNPLWNATLNTKNFSEYSQIVNNFYAEWSLTRELKITGRTSVTRKETGDELFLPASHTLFLSYTTDALVGRKGRYTYGDGYTNNIYADINATYSKNIGRHLFFANVGWSMSNLSSRTASVTAEGFPNDHLDDISFARQYMENTRPAGTESTTRDLGALSFLNYSYDDRFLADVSFRLNASSQFGSDNRWGKFWSAGLGWNLHKERFARHWKSIDQLKIRGSVGYTGSQNFNSYQSKSTFSYNPTDSYLGNYGAYLLGISNEKLQWQRKYDQNVGMDLSMFNRKLTVRADYYVATTNDLLTDVTLPVSTGFSSYKENLGKVENIGMEFRVGYRVWNGRSSGNFLSLYVLGARNVNRIKRISNSLDTYNKQQTEIITNKPVVRYSEGQSMTAIWAVPSYGIDPASGRDILIARDGTVTHVWNPDDLTVVGDTEPWMRGTVGFNFDYNGWSLNVGSNWRFGGQVYNQTLVSKVENADLRYNVDRRIFSDRWRNPGDVTMFRDIKNTATTRATQRFVEDQDEMVLSTVNLSYDLNRLPLFRMSKISRLRLSFNMNDATQISSVRVERGTAYPFARMFSFTLQAMF